MPTYVYRREDGTTFEVEQRITEEPLDICPTTGQRVTRVISGGTGFIFKGSGFYVTDYVRNKNGASSGKLSANGETDSSKTKLPDSDKEAPKAKSDGVSKSDETPKSSGPAKD